MGQHVPGCQRHTSTITGTVLPRAAPRQGRRGRGKDTASVGVPFSGWGQGCAGGMGLAAGRKELVYKDFLDGGDPCKKAVRPAGLGMLGACCRHSPAFYHAGEELLLGESIIVLFLFLVPPQGCWVQRSWLRPRKGLQCCPC